MMNIADYEATNQILWAARLECWANHNDVGHNIICRAQQHLNDATVTVLMAPCNAPKAGADYQEFLDALAEAMKQEWVAYIAGKCGPSGGRK